MNVVVSTHIPFFMAVAPLTNRINPVSLSLMIRDLHKFGPREANLWGQAMSQAYSHCTVAGNESITGERLSAEVFGVWKAANPGTVKPGPPQQEPSSSSGQVKTEGAAVKGEPGSASAAVKRELGSASANPAAKALKVCLSDPADVEALYNSKSPSSKPAVKVMPIH